MVREDLLQEAGLKLSRALQARCSLEDAPVGRDVNKAQRSLYQGLMKDTVEDRCDGWVEEVSYDRQRKPCKTSRLSHILFHQAGSLAQAG